MANAERVAALVIVCGIALALLSSLIIFVCCQLIYRVNKTRNRSKDCHRTVVFEHQTTTSEDNNGELFSYCFEESTSVQQGESEAQDSPSPEPSPRSSNTKAFIKGLDRDSAEVTKQKQSSSSNCSNYNQAPVIPTSSSANAPANVPSAVPVATTTTTATAASSISSSNAASLHHETYHQKRPELTLVDSCISQTSAGGGGSSSSLISSSGRHQQQQQQQHHHHQRLFTKQQDHRSKRFARSATLSHAGFPAEDTPSNSHHGRHHHHHVVFASTSLEVLGVDPCDPAAAAVSASASAASSRKEQRSPVDARDNVIEIEPWSGSASGERKGRASGETSGSGRREKSSDTDSTIPMPPPPAADAPALIGILRQTSVDVPEDVMKTLTINPLLSVKGESVDSSASEKSPETIKKQYQELWQLRAELEEEEKEKRSVSHEEERRERVAAGSSSIQLSASSESYRSNDSVRTDRPCDSGCKSLVDERKDYSIDQTSEKIYRQFATPSSELSSSSGPPTGKPASAHPSIEEEDEEEEEEEDDSEVVIFV